MAIAGRYEMNKTAMIWGAGGGIGRALVHRLREEGWRVLAMSRHTAGLGDLTPDLFEADVADPESVARAIEAAGRGVDQIDLWIYAVGDIAADKVAEASPGPGCASWMPTWSAPTRRPIAACPS
jgi:NAD(P)-dependent dehydrogenase (short-subunit alcohol dehydrogenase family)